MVLYDFYLAILAYFFLQFFQNKFYLLLSHTYTSTFSTPTSLINFMILSCSILFKKRNCFSCKISLLNRFIKEENRQEEKNFTKKGGTKYKKRYDKKCLRRKAEIVKIIMFLCQETVTRGWFILFLGFLYI